MIEKEEIIAILAKEKGIIITKNDPVLSFLILHDVIIDRYHNQFEALIEKTTINIENQFNEKIEELQNSITKAQDNYISKSKELSNEIIGGSVNRITKSEEKFIKLFEVNQPKNNENYNFRMIEYFLMAILFISILNLFLMVMK